VLAAVGAVGTPVKVGEAMLAFKATVFERVLTLADRVVTVFERVFALPEMSVTVFDNVLRFAIVA
jgi:hypothetical protein